PRSKAAAKSVAKLFAPADVKRLPRIVRPLTNNSMITVVVGATFHTQIAPAPPQATIVHHTAQVTFNQAASENLLRSVKRKVPFALEVPTVLESGSRVDSEAPVRAYAIGEGHKAVRLTFRAGGNLYWGVEE